MYLVLYRRLPKNQVSLIVVLTVMYGGGFLSSQIFPQIEKHQRHQQAVMHHKILQLFTLYQLLSMLTTKISFYYEESTNIKLELVIQSPR